METLSRPSLSFVIKTYFSLTKPGIIWGNAITASGGFAIGSRGNFNFALFFAMLFGLSLIVASASVFNNYIDRELDAKMERTKNRVLARGLISIRHAIAFAIFLGLAGVLLLITYTNFQTAVIAALGFFVYVGLYSFLKYRTVHATLIGSIAGAMPPVIGYVAAGNHLDLSALILFTMLTMWQMPHFFAIAIYRFEDYAAGSIPVLPIKRGLLVTKIYMLLYVIAFVCASLMLRASFLYLIIAAYLGLIWTLFCIKGFRCKDDKLWARKMFLFSLLIITVEFVMIPLSVLG